jgi:hypothetical protein
MKSICFPPTAFCLLPTAYCVYSGFGICGDGVLSPLATYCSPGLANSALLLRSCGIIMVSLG